MPVDTINLGDVIPSDAASPAVAGDAVSGHQLADVFVKLDKSAEWLIKAAGGVTAQRGILRRTTIVEELKEKMHGHDAIPVSANHDDDDDPMSALAEIDEPADAAPKTKKTRYTRKRKCKVVDVDMPQCTPARHPDCTSRKTVRLLGVSTNQVWLSLPDVPWLLTWLADSVSCGGVPVDPPAPLAANSPAVAGVNFQWDFADSWEAVLLHGPNAGTKIRTCVSNFTEEKWAAMNAIHNYGVPFDRSTYEQRKAATLHYLEDHCKRMAETFA